MGALTHLPPLALLSWAYNEQFRILQSVISHYLYNGGGGGGGILLLSRQMYILIVSNCRQTHPPTLTFIHLYFFSQIFPLWMRLIDYIVQLQYFHLNYLLFLAATSHSSRIYHINCIYLDFLWFVLPDQIFLKTTVRNSNRKWQFLNYCINLNINSVKERYRRKKTRTFKSF